MFAVRSAIGFLVIVFGWYEMAKYSHAANYWEHIYPILLHLVFGFGILLAVGTRVKMPKWFNALSWICGLSTVVWGFFCANKFFDINESPHYLDAFGMLFILVTVGLFFTAADKVIQTIKESN
ncbi:MAG: hypothetical protein NTX72_05805 [Candidatus Uhrbacteria bacterium]|nr:hypothetical protein [Candidatus Uhrbacteria bacterium]